MVRNRRRAVKAAALVGVTLAGLLPLAPSASAADQPGHAQPSELTTVKAGFVGGVHPQSRVMTQLATAPPTAPFTECPTVGNDTSCGLLIDVKNGGVTVYEDPSQGPYDGADDTLVGVLNQSSEALGHVFLASGSNIFGFDEDGICSSLYSSFNASCPFGPTGYEGPGTSFIEISPDYTSGVVSFNPTIAPGGTAYFSLEEPLGANSVVSGGPSLSEQGGAPNGSEKHSTCSTAHPVNCASGAFWHEFTDAAIPGRGVPLEFTRTYSSPNAAEDGPLGYGWTDSYNMSISIDGETGAATVREEGGSSVTFPSNGEGGFETPVRVLATLEANGDGTYTFSRYADHIKYVFSASGQLLREEDRNGDVTSLAYSGGKLTSVTDPSGRELTFAYSGAQIRTITDPMGRTTTFSYDANGNLKEATDPMGRTWSFTYDGSHRLLTMTDPRGGTTTNVYDGQGRVVSQTDPMGRESTWAYEGEAASPEGGTTIFTDARGDQTKYRFRALELLAVTHALGTAAENTTSYSYDPTTLGLATITDPNGYVTRNHFDTHGNLTESTDPMGRTSFYGYGPMDELLEATDPRGITTTYSYDANGNLVSTETPLTETGEVAKTSYAYEAQPGEVTAVTNPDGHVTHFGYDSAGDRISVTDAEGNQTTYGYNADGELVNRVSPRGNESGGNPAEHRTEFSYNADGELTKDTDSLGHTTEYSYDAEGNRTSVTNADGQTTHQVYDADNELTEVIRPDGSVLKTRWDAAGNMVAQIDAAGHATEYSYDAADRLVATTDPNGRTTTYGYEPNGNKSSSTNPEGETTSFSYDGDGELSDIYYSDGTAPVYEYYDEDGNRTYMSDGSGTSTYVYDSLNRMIESTDGAGATTRYGYDLAGHLTSLTYPNGQTATRYYDAAGNLTSVTDWLGHTTTFAYNADSGLASEQFPGGVSTDLSYDNADRIGAIEDANGANTLASFSYTRDPLGQVTKEVAENGEPIVMNVAHNSLDQLTAAGEIPYGYDAADNPTTFGAATQQFDAAGELTSATGPGVIPEEPGPEPPVAPPPPGGSTGGGGTGTASHSGAPSPSTSSAGAQHRSTGRKKKPLHCRKGFRKKKVHGKPRCVKRKRHHHKPLQRPKRHAHARASVARAAAPKGSLSKNGTAAVAQVAPRSNQSSTKTAPVTKLAVSSATVEVARHFSYNARGDRTSEELTNGGTRLMQYNLADELTQVGPSTFYSYNGDGLRVSKSVNGFNTPFVWNEGEALPELMEAGETSYLYGPEGQPIEEITGSTATFLHQDQQGSVRLLTDASGDVVGRYDYTAWGQVAKRTGSATSNLQYDGQYTDEETGFQYLRARYYDPGTGQFLERDPAASITQSRYSYAYNDPTSLSDPSGLWAVGTCVGATGTAGPGITASASGEACTWEGGNGLWPSWSATTFTVTGSIGVGASAGVSADVGVVYDTSARSPKDLAGPGCSYSISGQLGIGASASVGCNGLRSGGLFGDLGPEGDVSGSIDIGATDVLWASNGYSGWGFSGGPVSSQPLCNEQAYQPFGNIA